MASVGTFGSLLLNAAVSAFTFNDFKISTDNRFAQHDVHLETPVLEFIGPGLAEVSFSMNFNKQWGADPNASLVLLRTYLKYGSVSPLLIGQRPVTLGTNLFVCTRVGEEFKFFDGRGALFGAAVEVQLREYKLAL